MKARRMCCMAPGHSKTGSASSLGGRAGPSRTPSFSGCRRGRPPWRRALPSPWGEGRHLVQPGSDAAFPGGKGAGPTGSGGAAAPKRRNQLPGAGNALLNGLPWLAGAALLVLATLLLAILFCAALGTGKALALVPGLRRGMPFGLGGPGSCAGPHPAALLAAANGQISLLGATTATCSSWRKKGWQLSRKMPAARSSSTSWGSGSGRPCSFWREGRRCSACFLSRWGCISEGALVSRTGRPSFFFRRREAINRKVGIGDALVLAPLVPCFHVEVLEKGICCIRDPAHVIHWPRSVRPCGSILGLRL